MSSKLLFTVSLASFAMASAALAQAGAPPTGAAPMTSTAAQPGQPPAASTTGGATTRYNGRATTPGMSPGLNPSQPGYAGAAPALTPPAATAITPPSNTTPGAVGLAPPAPPEPAWAQPPTLASAERPALAPVPEVEAPLAPTPPELQPAYTVSRDRPGMGLVLIARRGDTLRELYASLYRGVEAPPFEDVVAVNPKPVVAGTVVVFPEPAGGWTRR